MLFNSLPFIFGLLPLTLVAYYVSARLDARLPVAVLIVASLVFYSFWRLEDVPILLFSMAVNYAISRTIVPGEGQRQITIGVALNLVLLAYFKYGNFAIENWNGLTGSSYLLLDLTLPLGISFWTFQQIAFLVARHRGQFPDLDFWRYIAAVTYFPHLIAGPIIQYKNLSAQLETIQKGVLGPVAQNLFIGIFLFSLGFFKKTVIADSFAHYSTPVFSGDPDKFGSLIVWRAALSYTFQIYFDFSGYVDMALGASRMFGITLPINFNSPYKARNIVDFWRRWHITLSNFLRDYLYISFGGNRFGFSRQMVNLMATMLLGGLWHGASWVFVLWGAMHGAMLVVNHSLARLLPQLRLPHGLAVLLTFLAVVFAWVPFRAEALGKSLAMWGKMIDIPALADEISVSISSVGLAPLTNMAAWLADEHGLTWCGLAIAALAIVWRAPNTNELTDQMEARLANPSENQGLMIVWMTLAGLAFGCSTLMSSSGRISEFLYFQF
jgi:alginate O-acetyltransferase complex protein AlgI